MKISKKPFSLDPQLANLKENISSHAKQSNWNIVAKELKKFGIKVDSDKKAKIIEGRYQLICDVLNKLFDFDNGGGPNTTRLQDGNNSEIQYALNDRDQSVIMDSFGSPILSKEGDRIDENHLKGSSSIIINAPIPKKGTLQPIDQSKLHSQQSSTLEPTLAVTNSKDLTKSISIQKLQKSPSKGSKVAILDEIDTNKDLTDTESTLEFILLGLSKNLGLKPKQTIGLLSNNHKYLIHIAVKGTKGGDFTKMSQWYQEMYSNAQHLVQLIDAEKEQNAMSLTLNIIKCGLFSSNPELAQTCCRILSKIGQEINTIGGELSGLAWDWFVNDTSNMGGIPMPDLVESQVQNGQNLSLQGESGLQACIYALRRHSFDFIEHCLPVLIQFGKNNYLELFTFHLKSFFPDKAAYLNLCHDIMMLVIQTSVGKSALINSQVLDHWIDQAIRQADFDGMNTPEERIAALLFLEQTWENKPDKIEEKTDVASALLTMLKRGCRDRSKILRIISSELMFQLLHIFAVERNQNAPILYKTLTFLLIEFHSDQEIREQMLKHFTTMFQQIQSMPVNILCEPLLKQIQISDGSTYIYNIYDFEFFTTIAAHKRLNVGIAIQVVEIMTRVAQSNIFFANSAISIMITLLQRYNKDPNLHHCFSQSFKQSLQVIAEQERQRVTHEDQRKQFLIQHVRDEQSIIKNSVSKYTLKKLQDQEKQKKQEQDQEFETANLARLTKEKLIVNYFQKMMMIGNGIIKQDLRMQLLSIYTKIEKELKTKSKAINYLLSLFGENIAQMLQYFIEHELPKQEQYQEELFPYIDSNANQQILKLDDTYDSSPNRALSLYDQNKVRKPKYQEKAMKEIERIKSIKMEQTNKKNLEEELKRFKDEKQITLAKKKIEERKILHGVQSKTILKSNYDDFEQTSPNRLIIKARDIDTLHTQIEDEYQKLLIPTLHDKEFSIISGADHKFANRKVHEVKLLDIRLEEQKDQDAVRYFVKKNLKVLRHLFNSYCFTIPGQQQSKTFDEKQNKLSQISVAEVIKLLKDFSISGLQVPKDDLMQLFRLINKEILKKSQKNQTSLLVLDFEGFVELILQISFYIYSFEAEMTPVEYLQRLFEHFKLISKQKKMATAKLFEDPDLATAIGDTSLIQELNRRLANNPTIELPPGFTKVVEKDVVNVYQIPSYFPITESKRVAVETLDRFLSDLFGFHILEPMQQVKDVYKVRTNIKHLSTEPLNDKRYMQPVKPRARSRMNQEKLSTSLDVNPIKSSKNSNTKRNVSNNTSILVIEPLEIKPTLGINLKIEVAKAPLNIKYHVLETAYVLEEILQAVELDQSFLAPRQINQKNKIMNRATEEKRSRMEEDEKLKKQQQLRLEQRKQQLKDHLGKMKEVQDTKQKNDQEEKKKKADQDKSLLRKKEQAKQKAFATIAKEGEEKRLKKQEEEQKKKEGEEKKRAQSEDKVKDKKQALKKKVYEIKEQLKRKIDDRQKSQSRKEEEEKKANEVLKLKRDKMNKFYQEKKLQKEKEKADKEKAEKDKQEQEQQQQQDAGHQHEQQQEHEQQQKTQEVAQNHV